MSLAAVLLLAPGVSAQDVAYVEWTSDGSEGKPGAWGYNAFDGREGTAWCSAGDGVGETLTVGFIGKQKVSEIGVIVGALSKGQLDKGRARLRQLTVSDGRTKLTLSFRDTPDLQFVKFKPQLDSEKMTFQVADVFHGAERGAPICISEIRLKRGSSEITGVSVGQRVRSLTTPKQRLLHLWVDQPGAPERYLVFSMDGTFRWVYAPILEGKGTRIFGEWYVNGSQLTLKSRAGTSGHYKIRHQRVDDGDQTHGQLVIEGSGLHDMIPGTYQRSTAE